VLSADGHICMMGWIDSRRRGLFLVLLRVEFSIGLRSEKYVLIGKKGEIIGC